jgi:hypothetical protein
LEISFPGFTKRENSGIVNRKLKKCDKDVRISEKGDSDFFCSFRRICPDKGNSGPADRGGLYDERSGDEGALFPCF